MRPGKLKQRLQFQKSAGGTDDDGFPINEPVPYLKTRGSLKTLRGDSFYTAATRSMEHNREFVIRYRQELDETVRPDNLQVVWNDVTHDIVSIENDDGLNVSMTVICRAVS